MFSLVLFVTILKYFGSVRFVLKAIGSGKSCCIIDFDKEHFSAILSRHII
jgi:hypothetical protein